MTMATREAFNKSIESRRYKIGKKVIRDSRSIATSLLITRGDAKDMEILVIKRGPAVKRTGIWSIPCGYLNWNESIYESACREAYEETGIRINPESIKLISVFDQHKTRTQNVVLCFYTHYDEYDYEIPENIQEFSLDEVTEAKWVKINGDEKDKIPSLAMKLLRMASENEIETIE